MNEPQLRLLLVAPEAADYSAVREIPLIETVAFTEPVAAVQTGADEEFDALILDGQWVHCGVVQQIAATNPRLPIIMVVDGEADEARAWDALEQGADDYLLASELSSVSICGALRNARKFRHMRDQRDEARQQLSESTTGVPRHFNERLTTSLTVIEALADTMDRQLDGHPAAAMGCTLLDEIECIQQMVADAGDSRRLAEGSLNVQRRSIPIGKLVQRILAQPTQRPLNVEQGTWDAVTICDQEKTVRAISRLADGVRELAPAAELKLVIDDENGRIGLQLSGGELTQAECDNFVSTPSMPAGEAGFERVVALNLLDSQQIHIDVEPTALWFDLPCNTQEMTQRWSNWMSAGDWNTVTLFELEADHTIQTDWAEGFLQRSLTCRDLVCPVSTNQWVIAMQGGVEESESRMRRLTATWKIMDSNSNLHSEIITSYRLPLQQEELDRRLMACFSASRRVLLLDNSAMPVSPINRRLVEAGFDVVSMEEPDALHAAADASVIVGDANSLETLEELCGSVCPPNIPVFLIGNLKDQQRALQSNVRLLNENSDDCFEDLIDAIEQSAPAPYGRRSTVTSY